MTGKPVHRSEFWKPQDFFTLRRGDSSDEGQGGTAHENARADGAPGDRRRMRLRGSPGTAPVARLDAHAPAGPAGRAARGSGEVGGRSRTPPVRGPAMRRALIAAVLLSGIGACDRASATPRSVADAVWRTLQQQGYTVRAPERCGENFYLVAQKPPAERIAVVIICRQDQSVELDLGSTTDPGQAARIYQGILTELTRRP